MEEPLADTKYDLVYKPVGRLKQALMFAVNAFFALDGGEPMSFGSFDLVRRHDDHVVLTAPTAEVDDLAGDLTKLTIAEFEDRWLEEPITVRPTLAEAQEAKQSDAARLPPEEPRADTSPTSGDR